MLEHIPDLAYRLISRYDGVPADNPDRDFTDRGGGQDEQEFEGSCVLLVTRNFLSLALGF